MYRSPLDLGPTTIISRQLEEIWEKANASELNNDTKQENRGGRQGHSTYFCIGFYHIYREKIYNNIKTVMTPME